MFNYAIVSPLPKSIDALKVEIGEMRKARERIHLLEIDLTNLKKATNSWRSNMKNRNINKIPGTTIVTNLVGYMWHGLAEKIILIGVVKMTSKVIDLDAAPRTFTALATAFDENYQIASDECTRSTKSFSVSKIICVFIT